MTKSVVSNWCRSAEARGQMPRVITDGQRVRGVGGEGTRRILPLYNEDEILTTEPIWRDTGYYQDKNGKVKRKDGKKLRK